MASVSVEQGAQAVFGDLRIGIMRIGSKQGRTVAQLALRGSELQEIVVVDVGDTVQLAGIGQLQIDAIEHQAGTVAGRVSVSFEPVADPAA